MDTHVMVGTKNDLIFVIIKAWPLLALIAFKKNTINSNLRDRGAETAACSRCSLPSWPLPHRWPVVTWTQVLPGTNWKPLRLWGCRSPARMAVPWAAARYYLFEVVMSHWSLHLFWIRSLKTWQTSTWRRWPILQDMSISMTNWTGIALRTLSAELV